MDKLHRERRLDGGAWVVMAVALVIAVYNITAWVRPLVVPGDGWTYADLVPREGQVRLIAKQYLTPEFPTALQPGDEVLAMGGVPVETILARALSFDWRRPEGWEPGGEVIYQVRRAAAPGETVDVVMAIRDMPRTGILRFVWPDWHTAVSTTIISLTILGVGLFVFWQRPSETAARVLLVFGVAFSTGLTNIPITGASLLGPALLLGTGLSPWQFVIIPSMVHLMLVFPVPKPAVRRHPFWVAAALYGLAQAALVLVLVVFWGRPAAILTGFYAVIAIETLTMLTVMVISVVHSWLTVRDPVAKAQLRWVTFGVLAGFMLGAGAWIVATLFFSFSGIFALVAELLFLTLPVCLGVAVLRYRLFDIDILINRALVYGSLTILLALVYLGSVVVLQWALGLLTSGESSEIVTVISTLGIAALFTPLRARVQAFMDRRFYRRKYDAATTLAVFGGTLRDEVELEALEARLIAVVDETMQPVQVGLWRRKEGMEG